GSVVWERPDGDAYVAFSPDGRWLVTGTSREFRFWQAGTWRPGLRLARAHVSARGPLAFSRDGSLLAVTSPSLVRLIDPSSGRELATLTPPGPMTFSWLRFSPDGGRLAAATEDHAIRLWDLGAVRRQLAAMGLDWERTSDPTPEAPAPPGPIRVEYPPE